MRIAVVDSGIAPNHPHVGAVAEGFNFVNDDRDTADRIGHGTAVAAAIREKVPDAELVPARVFDRELATTAPMLARAIAWAAESGCHVINLSLGSANMSHRKVFEEAVFYAERAGACVVSAYESDGTLWLPGSLPGVIGVLPDAEIHRDAIAVDEEGRIRASIYPRPIPGVPKERNLRGVSFAVANVSGFQARRYEASWRTRSNDVG